MTAVERVSYCGWPNCYRLANAQVELILTSDVGPRIIRFAFLGGENEFFEVPGELGHTGGEAWRAYGGHRLWHAPEAAGRTALPDNAPLQVETGADFVRVTQAADASGIEKQVEVRMGEHGARVTHRLRNANLWPVELAPWALSVMAPGGVAVLPLPPRGKHPEFLLPTSALALWAYTDMSDPRWTWGRRYILLRQDSGAHLPQKAGLWAPDGWAGYARNGHLFVKTFKPVPGARYADRGSALEAYTDASMLELETLGPLAALDAGAGVEHVEEWFLYDGVTEPHGDADVEVYVCPRVQEALGERS